MIKFGDPQVGVEEIEYVKTIFDSKVFVHGTVTVEFEKSFKSIFGYNHALTVANCTAGLHLAHFSKTKHLDRSVAERFEVVCPAMTHVATAHAIELAGLKAVFVDCNNTDGNMDIDLLELAITDKTVGIAAMHFNGVPCDIERIMEIAAKNDLYVVEDCAIALGARVNGRPVGSFGDAGVFSFHPVKQMTTGEGGMMVLNEREFHDTLKLERAFGVDRTFGERKQAGMYDVPLLGFNYRMAEIPAAIGVKQLEKFDAFEDVRKNNYQYLKDELSVINGLSIMGGDINDDRAYYCLIIKIDGDRENRDRVAAELKSKDIQTSVYYPHPVPRLAYYAKKYGYSAVKFKNAEDISDRSIALSIGAHLSESQLAYVVSVLKEVI
ncbi:MAG: DegT/DnrJ/EryC1/StrS family aminotransferase [Oceanospirillaceae bacterium]|nr:DegT/DnrJ/EryC1/StrS family aminotransferase [Oceanospirillaceae bacterium]